MLIISFQAFKYFIIHCVPIYIPAFSGNHCAYPLRDGQAELAWVAGYILRQFTQL